MRLLFLCKREPQRRDLISRPYGRFHHLPAELAHHGHEVYVALLSHLGTSPLHIVREGVSTTALDPRRTGIAATLSVLDRLALELQPDWIIGCSDAWYGWLAHWLARRTGAKLAVDAYDNYEAYMPWNLPLHWQWRRAIRAADVVTAAGPQLAALLQRWRGTGRRKVDVLPMAADPDYFPRDRSAARSALGLPSVAPLVGYLGSWSSNRGSDILLQSFARVRHHHPDVRLVISGRNSPSQIRDMRGVHLLGYLPDEQMPLLVSSLNVACVISADTAFGRYSYPSKLCEAIASNVAVAATATEPIEWMLHGDARHLAALDDPDALTECILRNLAAPIPLYPATSSWREIAREFSDLLLDGPNSLSP